MSLNCIKTIKEDWTSVFIDLLHSTKENIYLSSPFIKKNIADLIIDKINFNVDCKILTKFNIANIKSWWLDIWAIANFYKYGFKIKNISNLHAKIFIFDNYVIVGSANLTSWWIYNNIEYGVLFEDKKWVVKKDFLGYFNNKDYNFVSNSLIEKTYEFLNLLNNKQVIYKNNEFILENIDPIKNKLSKQNLLVIDCINKIWKIIFTTEDIYQFENLFNWKTPRNTIRRNLQELRDVWLLEFIKRWVYMKLWN